MGGRVEDRVSFDVLSRRDFLRGVVVRGAVVGAGVVGARVAGGLLSRLGGETSTFGEDQISFLHRVPLEVNTYELVDRTRVAVGEFKVFPREVERISVWIIRTLPLNNGFPRFGVTLTGNPLDLENLDNFLSGVRQGKVDDLGLIALMLEYKPKIVAGESIPEEILKRVGIGKLEGNLLSVRRRGVTRGLIPPPRYSLLGDSLSLYDLEGKEILNLEKKSEVDKPWGLENTECFVKRGQKDLRVSNKTFESVLKVFNKT